MNSVFLVVIAAMILIVVLLRFKVLIGPAILSGGLLIWLFESRSFEKLWIAFTETLTMQRTWDLLDRKSTRLNSSHSRKSRMPSSA